MSWCPRHVTRVAVHTCGHTLSCKHLHVEHSTPCAPCPSWGVTGAPGDRPHATCVPPALPDGDRGPGHHLRCRHPRLRAHGHHQQLPHPDQVRAGGTAWVARVTWRGMGGMAWHGAGDMARHGQGWGAVMGMCGKWHPGDTQCHCYGWDTDALAAWGHSVTPVQPGYVCASTLWTLGATNNSQDTGVPAPWGHPGH